MRSTFDEKAMELRVLHERGPRYISPEDLTSFLVKKLNESSAKKILKPVETLLVRSFQKIENCTKQVFRDCVFRFVAVDLD